MSISVAHGEHVMWFDRNHKVLPTDTLHVKFRREVCLTPGEPRDVYTTTWKIGPIDRRGEIVGVVVRESRQAPERTLRVDCVRAVWLEEIA
jgi:hypothetical protein